MNAGRFLRFSSAVLLLAGLTACEAERERSAQQDAVEYTVMQRVSAQCADAGFLPGSTPFNDCVAKLEGAPPAH